MSSQLNNITPSESKELLEQNIPYIDIRRADEWSATGIIKGAYKLTFFDGFGNYDLDKWMSEFEKIVKSKDEKFVLVCAHANRTKTVGDFLAQKMEYSNAGHLAGGMARWIGEGFETVR